MGLCAGIVMWCVFSPILAVSLIDCRFDEKLYSQISREHLLNLCNLHLVEFSYSENFVLYKVNPYNFW